LPDEIRLAGSLVLSLAACAALVPLAMRLALRTGFLDVPVGYKGHARPTPYLGGAAVVGAFVLVALALGGAGSRFGAILVWALVMFVVGTVDDRRGLHPGTRLAIEVVAAGALWHYGLGWAVFGNDVADIALTVFWIVGVVNAFNLMDNMDGAAGTVAAVSALGVAAVATAEGDVVLAALVLGIAGACLGFLPFNLARRSRIFLGDGGSMPIGFTIGAAIMALPADAAGGWVTLLVAAPLVALPILDTTLVVVSRRRRGVQVMSGGRDHLTHRLHARLGSAQNVALCLAAAQGVLCLTAIGLSQAGRAPVIAAALTYVMAGVAAIYALEVSRRASPAMHPIAGRGVAPEESAA
jgi:UDP-GlcNAc:undecaprenyl-phosphate/decaprenyl-phosphate GlcNAc-1-phosphate transferase